MSKQRRGRGSGSWTRDPALPCIPVGRLYGNKTFGLVGEPLNNDERRLRPVQQMASFCPQTRASASASTHRTASLPEALQGDMRRNDVIAVALCPKQTPDLACTANRVPDTRSCTQTVTHMARGQPSPANTQSAQQRRESRAGNPLLSSPHLGAVAEVECGFASNAEILSVLLSWRNRATVLCGLCRPCPAAPLSAYPSRCFSFLQQVLPLHRTHAIHLFVPFLPSSLPPSLPPSLPSSFLLEPLQVRAEFIRTPPPFNW